MARTRTRRGKTTKEELHLLVDQLPDEELHAARRYLEFLRQKPADPFLEFLQKAPVDDEPEMPEETAAVKEALEDVRHGRFRPWEEVREELLRANAPKSRARTTPR